jgi:HEPN domain-containing protein
MTWKKGELTVRRLIDLGDLSQVPASTMVADRLLNDATAHLSLARYGISADAERRDPAGALQLAYDAARKACAALLAAQGLRSTTAGGHVAVLEAVREQFNGANGVQVFGRIDRLRRRRHASEYPDASSPNVNEGDAAAAIEIATEALEAARKLLATGKVDPFR